MRKNRKPRKLTPLEVETVRYFLTAGWSPVKVAHALQRQRARRSVSGVESTS